MKIDENLHNQKPQVFSGLNAFPSDLIRFYLVRREKLGHSRKLKGACPVNC